MFGEDEDMVDIELDEEDIDDEEDKKGKVKPSKDEDEDDDSDDDVEVVESDDEDEDERLTPSKKAYKDETQEEKRERRRRERQQKNERNRGVRRDLARANQLIAQLSDKVKSLEGAATDFEKRVASQDKAQIETAMNAQKTLYQTAEAEFNKAITEGNGAAAANAQRIMLEATTRFTKLTDLKNSSDSRPEVEKSVVTEKAPKTNGAKEIYTQRWMKKNDWFDLHGSDKESRRARQIDREVAEDGFDPSTKEYWEELDDRLREELPHVYEDQDEKPAVKKAKAFNPKPKQVNGSLGADSASTKKAKIEIPKHVVKIAKTNGYWDDPKMRKIFIRNWKQQNPGS